MRKRQKKMITGTLLKVAAGAAVVGTAVLLRGMLPELVRYIRIERM